MIQTLVFMYLFFNSDDKYFLFLHVFPSFNLPPLAHLLPEPLPHPTSNERPMLTFWPMPMLTFWPMPMPMLSILADADADVS